MLNLMLMMLTMILAGLIARRIGILMPDLRNKLTDLLLKIILPCNIVDAYVSVNPGAMSPWVFAQLVLISAAVHVLSAVLGRVLYRRAPEDRKSVLGFGTTFSNANFFGLPVILGLYGPQGVLFLSVALIPLRIFLWTYGLHLFGGNGGETRWWRGLLKVFTHPCIIAVAVGLLLMGFQVPMPAFFVEGVKHIGNCVTPVSLMIVGAILAEAELRTMLDGYVLYYSAVRLLVIPLALLGVLKLLSVDPMVTAVCVLMFAMPAATMTAALAARYEAGGPFGAKCVVFSTMVSLFTLPLIQMLL